MQLKNFELIERKNIKDTNILNEIDPNCIEILKCGDWYIEHIYEWFFIKDSLLGFKTTRLSTAIKYIALNIQWYEYENKKEITPQTH